MSDWITEGVSSRSPWGITNPVIHLLITSDGDRMWCSGGSGRPEVHHANSTPTGRLRYCRECRALAQEAVNDGTLDIGEVPGWRLNGPVCPCGEPGTASTCPGSWHGCQWHDDGDGEAGHRIPLSTLHPADVLAAEPLSEPPPVPRPDRRSVLRPVALMTKDDTDG